MKSTPRSSRKRRGRRSSREDVAIDPPFVEAQPLGDEVSGTGSPATPRRGVVDPAGVNGLVALQLQSDFPPHAFRIDGLEGFRMDKRLALGDKWALDLIGNRFKFKDLECIGG